MPQTPDSAYAVVVADGYLKVMHPKHGTVAAGVWNAALRSVSSFEFTEDRYRKANAIRQPACAALQSWLAIDAR